MPVPKIETESAFTRVTIYEKTPFHSMSKEDRIWACYMHACSLHALGMRMTNASLRVRFNLDASQSVAISRLIKAACEDSLIKAFDDSAGNRNKSYIPFWA